MFFFNLFWSFFVFSRPLSLPLSAPLLEVKVQKLHKVLSKAHGEGPPQWTLSLNALNVVSPKQLRTQKVQKVVEVVKVRWRFLSVHPKGEGGLIFCMPGVENFDGCFFVSECDLDISDEVTEVLGMERAIFWRDSCRDHRYYPLPK